MKTVVGSPRARQGQSFGVLVISVVGMVMVMMIVIPGQTMAITLSMVILYNREDNDGLLSLPGHLQRKRSK